MTLKISTRLWLPTAALGGLLVLLAATVGIATQRDIASTGELLRSQEAKLQDAATWQGLTSANAARVVASVLSNEAAVEAALKPEIEAASARISEIQQRIDSASRSDAETAALARIAAARKAYIDARTATAKVKAGGDVEAARARLASQVQPAVGAYLASQQAYVALQLARSEAVRAEAGDKRLRMAATLAAVMLVVLFALALGTVLLVRSILRPMHSLVDIARRIGEGDLDVAVPQHRNDEIGAVMDSLTSIATRCATSSARCANRPNRSRWPARRWPRATMT